MRGGWQGPMGSIGGITRTYGLQKHFDRPAGERPARGFDRETLRRMLGYFRPYARQGGLILLCLAGASGLAVLPPFCVGMILDQALPTKDGGLLALLAGAMVALALVSGMIGVIQQSLTARVGQRIMYDLRNQLFRHLQAMGIDYYTRNRSGEIVSRINNDVNAVQGVATGTLVSIISNLFTLTATTVALLSMSVWLALLAVLVVPFFYLPSWLVGQVRRRLSGETQIRQAEMQGFLHERLHVGGAILSKIFGQERVDAERFAGESGDLANLHVRQAVVGRWLFMVLSVFSAVGPALVYWYGGHQVIAARMTPGALVAFAALLTQLYRPLMQLASVYVDIQAAVAVFERIFELLDTEPSVQDAPAALAEAPVEAAIAFEAVEFRYPGAVVENGEPPFALQGVSFTIAPGEQVALVGPSGAGKSTLTYLVPRFYDPLGGRVTLGGKDLRAYTQGAIRSRIGMVTQETFLFHTTVRENLLYARPEATEAELVAACQAAHIHDFIAALPAGYETVVGERGFRLSGGEKQRLSIARAILKDPAILILDEATSSLDATSEQLIQQALERLLTGRTALIIAHRLSTILHADRIVVLDQGRVRESGRHEALLRQGGLYAELFHKQFGRVLAQENARIGGGLISSRV